MGIFNLLGSLCGYVLWVCFLIFKNFGVSIIVFTVLFKLVGLPLSIKQQKSMAVTQRLNAKQQEIREKYANNKEKMNEEIQKLYERENASPMSGCLTSFLPLLLMMGIFYSVAYPLSNTLHINSDSVNQAVNYVNSIPGLASTSSYYTQIEFVKIFPKISSTEFISNLFTPAELNKITMFGNGFNFLGLDLLQSPNANGFSHLLLIQILCLVTSLGSQIILQKLQGTKMQGCMTILLYGMPLFTAYIAYTVPAAVGVYWIASTIFSAATSIIMQRWYSPQMINAKAEAQRIALLEINEQKAQKL